MEKNRKGLTAWQLTMMAVGSVIGGSFFLGSSVAINAAGPAILLSYILGGIIIYFILFALSEMTVANPEAGSFQTFAAKAFGKGAGFVVGWVYWSGMVLAMSSEATAASILIRNWVPYLPIELMGSLIIITVTLVNLLGSNKLGKLESSLTAIKLLAIASFIILALVLIIGIIPGKIAVGIGALARESLFPGGVKSIAGSMLIVIFAYAGFEVIGLAASETENPRETVPKAIKYTVFFLVASYILSVLVVLPLVTTASLSDNASPMVTALDNHGISWAGTAINIVLIAAILSTMLAAMFGLGRMIRSLAEAGDAPKWLKDDSDVPYRGILFSGFAMLLGLGFGLLLPKVYIFLISSGGFAFLFTYAVIMATHIKFRKNIGCPPEGKCQMPGFPYASWFVLVSMIVFIISMPFIPGQSPGLVAGILIVAAFTLIYAAISFFKSREKSTIKDKYFKYNRYNPSFSAEFSKELNDKERNKNNENEK